MNYFYIVYIVKYNFSLMRKIWENVNKSFVDFSSNYIT
jgi:hypothetical protein